MAKLDITARAASGRIDIRIANINGDELTLSSSSFVPTVCIGGVTAGMTAHPSASFADIAREINEVINHLSALEATDKKRLSDEW
jgi:hypothetical protein